MKMKEKIFLLEESTEQGWDDEKYKKEQVSFEDRYSGYKTLGVGGVVPMPTPSHVSPSAKSHSSPTTWLLLVGVDTLDSPLGNTLGSGLSNMVLLDNMLVSIPPVANSLYPFLTASQLMEYHNGAFVNSDGLDYGLS
ncbi:hypothetical protein FRC10_001227, partial [Ceratobasidium sp. 414]